MNTNPAIRVLVAEDDFLVSKEICRALNSIGFEIIALSRNGKESVEKTRESNPDVVLMDLKMPEMDGLEAAQKIQAVCPTPVVILTAYDDQDSVEKAVGTGGVGAFLLKPPKPQEIERSILIAIARHAEMLKYRKLYATLLQRTRELEKAQERIKTLEGILPICCQCKKIRDEEGRWKPIEAYICARSNVEFSHGYCPECGKMALAELE